jgi:SAM-dependent methyltransferase
MAAIDPKDYVLGTHDAEVGRLGLQHRVWREAMRSGWERAGLEAGMRVIDVGAGPGYAALELAEAVGPEGQVLAVERSPRFAEVLRSECGRRGIEHVEVLEGDVMDPSLLEDDRIGAFDLAWCRWIACFLPSLNTYARLLRKALRPGGRVVTHEYARYGTWQFVPPREHHHLFISQVIKNWRSGGGEPDIAGPLVATMRREGFQIVETRPLIFTVAPDEPFWEWPASFIGIHARHLQELGQVSGEWVEAIMADLDEAESDPQSRMITPLVLEIIAERI